MNPLKSDTLCILVIEVCGYMLYGLKELALVLEPLAIVRSSQTLIFPLILMVVVVVVSLF